jgi:hypothetical protein
LDGDTEGIRAKRFRAGNRIARDGPSVSSELRLQPQVEVEGREFTLAGEGMDIEFKTQKP